ncbi:FAD-dependent oxidoreductase [Streptomyces decoyicus]
MLRTRDDSARLFRKLAADPRRVLVIGAGFTGFEMASVCGERDLEVTVAERAPAPLVGALGEWPPQWGGPAPARSWSGCSLDAGCRVFDVNRARRCTVRRHPLITGMRRRAAG